MTSHMHNLVGAAALVAFCAASSATMAASIPIPNGDLEAYLPSHTGFWLQLDEPEGTNAATWQDGNGNNSWSAFSNGGAFGSFGPVGTAHSGQIIGWAGIDRMHQVLTDTLQAGETYTLQAYAGSRSTSNSGVLTLYLFRGDMVTQFLAGSHQLSSNTINISPNTSTWMPWTTQFTATGAEDGVPIGVGIHMSNGEVWWDTMTLDGPAATVIPEPSIMALAVLATFGLAFAGWRRRRRA